MREKAIGWFLYIFTLLLAINVIRSWVSLQKRDAMMLEQHDKLEQVKEEQSNLERKLAQVQSPQYIEQELRNKLNLGKEGEIILLLPSVSPMFQPTPTAVPQMSNMKQWIGTFL